MFPVLVNMGSQRQKKNKTFPVKILYCFPHYVLKGTALGPGFEGELIGKTDGHSLFAIKVSFTNEIKPNFCLHRSWCRTGALILMQILTKQVVDVLNPARDCLSVCLFKKKTFKGGKFKSTTIFFIILSLWGGEFCLTTTLGSHRVIFRPRCLAIWAGDACSLRNKPQNAEVNLAADLVAWTKLAPLNSKPLACRLSMYNLLT